MAKRTTARGKGKRRAKRSQPELWQYFERLDQRITSEVDQQSEMLNLLGERVNVLDSRVTGEIKVLRERVEQLENAKPSPERTFKPTYKPNAEGPCVILAGAPWQGFRVYGAFINHEEAYLYQNKHLFREDFWWVLPLERTH